VWDRFGGVIAFDQFTDTGLGSPYLAQGRYMLNYRVLPSVMVGLQYTDPLIGDETAVVPGAGTTPFRSFEVIQGLLTVGGTTLGVGYVDELDSMTFSFMQTRSLTDRLSAVLNGSYDENVGLWTGFVGLEFELSRRGAERWLASRSATAGNDVVRGDALLGLSSNAIEEYEFGDDMDHLYRRRTNQQALNELANRQARKIAEKTGKCPPGYKRSVGAGGCFCVRANPFDQFPCP